MSLDGAGRFRVAVVGGGLAGLSAAIACADQGADVTLFEARSRLGGATFSFRRDGLSVDNGQHVFLRCCTAYRWFLRRVGAEDAVSLQPRLRIPLLAPGGRRSVLARSPVPAPLHLAAALARYPFLSVGDRLRLVRAATAILRLDPVRDRDALDRQTFAEWLRRHGQSRAAVERLWDLFALPTLNLHAEDASLALAVKVFRTGLLDSSAGGDVGYATRPLSEVHAVPAQRVLRAAGARVVVRAPVRAVQPAHTGPNVASDDDPPAVVLDGDRVTADAVIVATPHQEAAALLPASAETPGWAALGSSPIVNLHVVYDRRVMDDPFAAGVGTPVQWVFDRTAQSGLRSDTEPGARSGQYLAVSLSGADAQIDEPTASLRARFLPALEDVLPRARGATVRSFFVTRERAATFRQAAGTAAHRPRTASPWPGVFLAGAWTDTGWPATMEGAVRSGVAAARAALAMRGRHLGAAATSAPTFAVAAGAWS